VNLQGIFFNYDTRPNGIEQRRLFNQFIGSGKQGAQDVKGAVTERDSPARSDKLPLPGLELKLSELEVHGRHDNSIQF
jgi:hypothetical protein